MYWLFIKVSKTQHKNCILYIIRVNLYLAVDDSRFNLFVNPLNNYNILIN